MSRGNHNQNPVKGHNVFSEAISYYRTMGYQLVTVPWLVDMKFIRATYDGPLYGVPDTAADDFRPRQFVGSAEQSFLSVWDKLESGQRYMALTPCMRYEEQGFSEAECRLPGFMKLELFVKGEKCAESIRKSATRFFSTWIPTVRTIETDKGWDIITANNTELGSYYNATFEGQPYSCGTGLAWERLLFAMGIKVPNLWLNSSSTDAPSSVPNATKTTS